MDQTKNLNKTYIYQNIKLIKKVKHKKSYYVFMFFLLFNLSALFVVYAIKHHFC